MGFIDIEMFATLDLVGQSPGGPAEDPVGFPFGGWQAPHPTARRSGAGPPSRRASDAARSSGSRIRHTSESFCAHGRSEQSWANMPPRAFTGASWWASPTSTVFTPAFVVAVSSWRRSSVPTMPASSTITRVWRSSRRVSSRNDASALATV